MRARTIAIAVLAGALVASGCGDDDRPSTPRERAETRIAGCRMRFGEEDQRAELEACIAPYLADVTEDTR